MLLGRGRREVRLGAVEVRRGSREEWEVDIVGEAVWEWVRGVRDFGFDSVGFRRTSGFVLCV